MKQLLLAFLLLAGLAVLWFTGAGRSPGEGQGRARTAESVASGDSAGLPLVEPPSLRRESLRRESVVPESIHDGASGTTVPPAPAAAIQVPEAAFHGLVLDALSQRPIAGARAFRVQSERRVPLSELESEEIPAQTTSDAFGRFVLPQPDGPPVAGHVLAQGYGPGAFVLDGRHASPERAAAIELLPAAALEVRVRDGDGRELEGARVDLVWPVEPMGTVQRVTSRRAREVWRAHTDATGTARLSGLPAEAELVWNVLPADDSGGRTGRVALAPGEMRQVEVVIGGGALLYGHVRDEVGAPAPGLGLWLQLDGISGERQGLAKALTDESGRYEFRDLPFETLQLGLAPGEDAFVARGSGPIVLDRSVVEHDLELAPGLFLAGRVTGDERDRTALDIVTARPAAGGPGHLQDLEGSGFRLGPVAPGLYRLFATGENRATAVVEAVAGASDIELELLASRPVEVRIEGAGTALEVACEELERGREAFQPIDTSGGQVWRSTLPYGTYALLVTGSDERVGFLGDLRVSAALPEGEVRVHLQFGARCTFVHRAGKGLGELRLRVDGARFFASLGPATLLAGAARTVLVPAGTLAAELLVGERVVARATRVVGPGERCRIVLENP